MSAKSKVSQETRRERVSRNGIWKEHEDEMGDVCKEQKCQEVQI